MLWLALLGMFVAGFALYFWAYGTDQDGEPAVSGCAGYSCLAAFAAGSSVSLIVTFFLVILVLFLLDN